MQRISALMADVVHEQGGTAKNFTGDGIMALFGVPVALEDAPIRACARRCSFTRPALVSPEIEHRTACAPRYGSASTPDRRSRDGAERRQPPPSRRSGTRWTWRRGCSRLPTRVGCC